MSLRLLVDEDTQAKYLVTLLRQAGHDVITVNSAGLMSKSDSAVLGYAREERRLVLTRNCDDFLALHKANPNHPGILAIYQHSNVSKSMSYLNIVTSINNLETSGYSLTNQFITLNQWNY